jgi:hypothetical protein
MRFHQLIEKDIYTTDLEDDIVNLLTISSSKGYNKIKTSKLVNDLRSLGYDVNNNTIQLVLNDLDMITSSDNNFIEISTDIPDEDDTDFSGIDDLDIETNTAFDAEETDEPDEIDRAAQRQAAKDIAK